MITIEWIFIGLALAAAASLAMAIGRRQMTGRRQRQFAAAKRQFQRLREQLEAKFLQRAGLTGKPRGLRWADCEFEDDVSYARDRQSGQLSAFVAVCIKFEAVEGGGMEEVEAVGNHKYGTAVFYWDPKHQWTTEGRAIFNLAPRDAVRHFQATMEPVAQE